MANNKEVPYLEFGERLMKLRKKANMTRQQLGEICGVAPSTIVNYERGTRIPYADTAVKMAQHFNLTVPELLGMENPELAMAQAQGLENMRRINGKKGEDRFSAALSEAGAHLAGGEISEEKLIEYTMELNKLALQAQQRLREIHTNKRYKDTVEAKAAETKEQVAAINEAIESLTSEQ